jgi:hypothetical protein
MQRLSWSKHETADGNWRHVLTIYVQWVCTLSQRGKERIKIEELVQSGADGNSRPNRASSFIIDAFR